MKEGMPIECLMKKIVYKKTIKEIKRKGDKKL